MRGFLISAPETLAARSACSASEVTSVDRRVAQSEIAFTRPRPYRIRLRRSDSGAGFGGQASAPSLPGAIDRLERVVLCGIDDQHRTAARCSSCGWNDRGRGGIAVESHSRHAVECRRVGATGLVRRRSAVGDRSPPSRFILPRASSAIAAMTALRSRPSDIAASIPRRRMAARPDHRATRASRDTAARRESAAPSANS